MELKAIEVLLLFSFVVGLVWFFFSHTVHLCDDNRRSWQKTIHSTKSVIQGVIVKWPLQRCTLPDNLK